jgi:serpin B
MRTPLRCAGAVLVAVGLLAACGSSGAKTSKPRTPPGPSATTVPGVKLIGTVRPQAAPDAATLRAAAQGEAGLGVALYRQLATGTGNVAIAPSSLVTVLGMIEAGARGATAQQLVDAFHVPRPAAQLSIAIGGLAQSFAARSSGGVKLDEVDQAWLQQGRSVLTPYADTLAGPFGAPLATIDFDHAGAAASTINSWFSDNTHGKITKLLEASDLENQVVLVLTDAVYLDAQWAHGFDTKRTAPAPFHTGAGTVENVPTMHLDGGEIESGPRLGYAAGTGWKAVALPYKGNQLEMDVIVPDDLHAFESTFDGARLAAVLAAIQPANVVLSMPKFDVTAQSDLVSPLRQLGVRDVFDPSQADLSGIDGRHDLFVSAVKQKVVVHVDEQGTVAAAATAGIAQASAAPLETVVQIDQPFVYVVRDRTTGAVLFLGRVTDPQG